jgi:2-oxoisovalerate dehydrogenase E1 component alpha subunit
MMCHCISNQRDNAKGRQMPVHYTWREGNFVSISSPVGTQFPQAVGAAMAFAYRGEENVAISWVGDGTAAEGDFHYAINFAAVYRAPVILNVVNNQWAISTHMNISIGGATFAARGIAYGLPSIRVDGNDFLALYAVTQWAAERARQGLGATFIEVFTYRGEAHSTSDDPTRYRPKNEWKSWPLGDPIERLKAHLKAIGEWDNKKHKALEKELNELVIKSYKKAEEFGTLDEGRIRRRARFSKTSIKTNCRTCANSDSSWGSDGADEYRPGGQQRARHIARARRERRDFRRGRRLLRRRFPLHRRPSG